MKRQLVDAGWLEEAVVPVGRGRKTVLRLSARGRELVGRRGAVTRESLAHRYLKHWHAEQLRVQGYDVQVEAEVAGGRIDVLATREGERVAVEIETGASNVVSNVRKCLRAGCRRVVVVAADSKVKRKLERSLARVGLLISGRVVVE